MLQVTVPSGEIFNESTSTFITTKETVLTLEHSLLSISKWESMYHKAFLDDKTSEERTPKELLDYIKCMTINTVPEEIYLVLTNDNLKQIVDYINETRSASVVNSYKKGKKERITSELIYYWMLTYNIPFTCERWHISRLIMLIRICGAKDSNQKMDKKALLNHNRALNKARRQKLNTRG